MLAAPAQERPPSEGQDPVSGTEELEAREIGGSAYYENCRDAAWTNQDVRVRLITIFNAWREYFYRVN